MNIQYHKPLAIALGLLINISIASAQCTSTAPVGGVLTTAYSGPMVTYTICDNGVYILKDIPRGIHTRECPTCGISFTKAYAAVNSNDYTDLNNQWNSSDPNYQDYKYALDAHWAAGITLDYFKKNHCRDSYDDLNSDLLIYMIPNNTVTGGNASWHSDDIMVIDYFSAPPNPLSSLDFVAHEFGHGVAKYAISGGLNLGVNSETDAISEGLADIWAICVENYANQLLPLLNKSIWVQGEDPYGTPSGSRQADVLTQSYYPPLSGSAHANGNILTHWFYLFTYGNGSPELPITTDLNASIQAAADIVYRAETVYMHSNTNFHEMLEMTYLAALDFYPADCEIVNRLIAAWEVVGISSVYAPDYLISHALRAQDHILVNAVYDQSHVSSALSFFLQNLTTLEFIATSTISNNSLSTSGLLEFSATTTPIILTAAESITLTTAATSGSNTVHIKAGSDFLARIDACGVTPPDVVAQRCILALPKPAAPKSPLAKLENSSIALQVFPNPTNGQTTIQLEGIQEATNTRLAIYDLHGKLVQTIAKGQLTSEVYTYDFKNQPAGVYAIQLITSERVYTQKVVLTR